ncbi:IS110 family transposase [Brevibacillus sp. SYP-B805]|nr:IS110 family transposase [Brevibacillus sp. SYP-B805]
MMKLDEEAIADCLLGFAPTKSKKWALEKAQKVLTAAQNCPSTQTVLESHLLSLKTYITLLLQLQEHLKTLEKQIDTLAKEVKEYDLLLSIPGIGPKIAATILSEIGEIERFDHPKKLVAFVGIDPSVHQSGKFTATQMSITKRGSKRLRKALYMAVQCSLRRSGNPRLRQYFDQKRETKPYKVAVIACANKLLHLIYAILKKGVPYQEQTV